MIVYEGMVCTIHPAKEEDCEPVAANLRESDVVELRDGVGQEPLAAIATSFAKSALCWTVKIAGEPVAMFGVAPDDALFAYAHVWYLATDRWDREGKRDVLAAAPRFIQTMLSGYDMIGNFVDCRNTRSIRWLKMLGFKQGAEVRNTASGKPFVLMYTVNHGV